MSTARLIWLFLQAIPDLIKLLEELDHARIAFETDRKVTDDLKTLHQAFANKDAAAVTALFSGVPDPVKPAVISGDAHDDVVRPPGAES